jgi:hypothetical protein
LAQFVATAVAGGPLGKPLRTIEKDLFMTHHFKSMAAIALAVTFAPLSGVPLVSDMFGSGYAHAAGKSGEDHGNSSDHGNSGDRGNSGGEHGNSSDHGNSGGERGNSGDSGNSSEHGKSGDRGNSGGERGKSDDRGNSAGKHGGSDANSDETPWNRAEVHNDRDDREPKAKAAREANEAAMAGAANAADASVQGLLHASPNSSVGRLKTYADLTFGIESEFGTALEEAQSAFDEAYPDFDTLTDEEQAAALASPEGIALDETEQDLETAQTKADAAFARVAKNPESKAVRNYVDRLLSDYYDYLANQ